MYILYVSLSIYFNISLFECLLKPCPNSGDPGPLLVSSQQSTSLSNDGKPNHQPRSTQGGPNHCTQMVQLVKRLSENPVFRSTSSGFLSPLNPC